MLRDGDTGDTVTEVVRLAENDGDTEGVVDVDDDGTAQVEAAVELVLPGGHGVQVLEPVPFVYVLGGQGSHVEEPFDAVNQPGSQGEHTGAPANVLYVPV